MNPDEPRKTDAEYRSGLDFARLAEMFEQLRALPDAERADALTRVTNETPALGTELRRLFEQHSEDPEELASPDAAFGADQVAAAVEAADPIELPTSIGPYQPIRELGRGGMGVVYLARREDSDFEKLVAIKLLRAPLDDLDLQRRFRTERRILAGLVHPNIAGMFDGGTTDLGQPYVVMEYVDGDDFLTHCRRRDLSLGDRLRLFVKVCRAVAHAHHSLVVHRDLKPSNILLSTDGEPKLLDFGIAKLLQPDPETEVSLALTRTGNMLLTPEYGSPEQVRGEPITTATDVYALGVILYELLSGERAQPLPDRSLTRLIEVICERTPPPPSQRHPTQGRPLRGDLDTIVQAAMQKEPDRRYPSAEALADDVERYLTGLPIRARGDTMTYRTRKFVGRHRLAIAATTLLFALLVAFAVTTAVQNRQIAQERDDAVTQRVVADEIAAFLIELFDMAAPDAERAEVLHAKDLLDRGARRVHGEVSNPERRAPLQLAMGQAYLGLGLYDDAAPLLEAAETHYATTAPDSLDHRRAQDARGQLEFARGNDAAGEDLLRASLAPAIDGTPEPAQRVLRAATLASWLRECGRFDSAEQVLAEVEAGLDETLDSTTTLPLILQRAAIMRDRGELDPSLTLLEQARSEADLRGGAEHPRYLALHRQLGQTRQAMHDLEEARDGYQTALDLSRDLTGESHPNVEYALFSLAMLEIDQGDLREAERLLREILAREEDRFGSEHAYPAQTKAQLARVLTGLGRPAEAEPMFLEALAIQRRVLPAEHPELATTISNLANLYLSERRLDEAATLYTEALEIRQQSYPEDHSVILTTRNSLAVLELSRGNHAAAERELRIVLEARRATLGESPEVAGSLLSLATAISRQGRDAAAIPLFEQSIALFDATLTAEHPDSARPRVGLALSLLKTDEPERGETLLREAIDIRRAALGDGHFLVMQAEYYLARSLVAKGQEDAAKAVLDDLIARLQISHADSVLLERATAARRALE